MKSLVLSLIISSSLVCCLSFEKGSFNRVYKEDDSLVPERFHMVDKRLLRPVSPREVRVEFSRMTIPDVCEPFLPACPPNTVTAGKKCYRYVSEALTWSEAKKDCEEQGGMLAIPDFSYNNTLVDLGTFYRGLAGKSNVWIGATDVNASAVWQWVDGKVLDVRHPSWVPGSPGKFDNCAAIHKLIRGPWQIIHRSCTAKSTFLCQFDYYYEATMPDEEVSFGLNEGGAAEVPISFGSYMRHQYQ